MPVFHPHMAGLRHGATCAFLLALVSCFVSAAQAQSSDAAQRVELSVGGYLQTDARLYANVDLPDALLLRRARVKLAAEIAPRFRVEIESDFGKGRVGLTDGWAEADLGAGLRARAGRFKTPFGLEVLHSSRRLWFAERAFPAALAPHRDLGVMLHGAWQDGRLEAALGVFNGVADGQDGTQEHDDAKDVAARLWSRPFGGMLAGLGLGMAVSHGVERGTAEVPGLDAYEAPGDLPLFAFRRGIVADGPRTRFGPQARLDAGLMGVMAEYTHTRQRVREIGGEAIEVVHHAWQVAVIAAVPGTSGPRERRAFGAGRGPVEVAFRVHRLALDAAVAPLAASDPDARSATAWATALHWYPSPETRLGLHVERILPGHAAGITFVTARAQVAF